MPRSTNNNSLVTHNDPKSPISEAYRTLRTNIQFSSFDEAIQVIMVASANPGEGKSTTASNLAVTYAQEGKKVLLIDADLRKPSVFKVFNVSNRVGLSTVVSGQCRTEDAIQDTDVDNLFVLPSGPVPPNPSELLASQSMKAALEDFKASYDIVIFDTPPVLAVTDSLIVSAMCQGVLLVVHAGKVKSELVRKAKTNLEHVNARILGVVLNNTKSSKGDKYNYYYYGAEAR
ncbi:CpsD/CapB family tyrosine-protein kinase [Paenibacillus pasadenensis]|uniref:CpsD/CapB family tyrosine-protein kinase n=1 Tax=Paenibacillus pasadenensis TaxID=217090 RepID=UPI00203B61D0|nr:CpsD/CapB family tyrosine-protein kinase [Paenibacillus pasadenensis]MCM3749157.1 CpsD/CapB family tyrosine-protein kinase [Paenibacillus pasadenensis]